jgi:hypothetical protein
VQIRAPEKEMQRAQERESQHEYGENYVIRNFVIHAIHRTKKPRYMW